MGDSGVGRGASNATARERENTVRVLMINKIIIAGLDPAIHGGSLALHRPWTPGSSPWVTYEFVAPSPQPSPARGEGVIERGVSLLPRPHPLLPRPFGVRGKGDDSLRLAFIATGTIHQTLALLTPTLSPQAGRGSGKERGEFLQAGLRRDISLRYRP